MPLAARALFHLAMMERGYYLARRGIISLSLTLGPADFDGFIGAVEAYCEQYEGVLRGLGG